MSESKGSSNSTSENSESEPNTEQVEVEEQNSETEDSESIKKKKKDELERDQLEESVLVEPDSETQPEVIEVIEVVAETESKQKEEPEPAQDEEISLTADIGDSEEVDKDAFLELDTDTRVKMEEIEAEEQRVAEEAAKAAEEEEELETGIFAIKTSIGHEKMVANWLAIRARKRKLDIYAILSPPKLRGYLLLEGIKNKEAMQDMIKGVQHARSVVDGSSSIEEIEHFLTPKPLVSGIEEGDVVEIIAGPFKGEKAKVTQIDEAKEEITVELFEAMVSIPVTIRGDHVRILEKENK